MTETASGEEELSWPRSRIRESWHDRSRVQKAYFSLILLGFFLAWFGETVFWAENGYGFLDHHLLSGPSDGKEPFLGLSTHLHVILGAVIADGANYHRVAAWIAGLYFATIGVLLVYLFAGTHHPLALVPALPFLGATVVKVVGNLRSS